MSAETMLQPAGKLSISDVIKFAYFHQLRWLWPLVALCLGFSLLGLAVVISTGDPARLQNPGLYYVMILVLVLLQLAFPYLTARRQYSKTQYLRESMRFYITRENIRLEGPSFSSTVTWPLVRAAYETKNAFLIYLNFQTAWILPKRFFWGDSAMTENCRQLISGSLARPKRLRSTPLLSSWF